MTKKAKIFLRRVRRFARRKRISLRAARFALTRKIGRLSAREILRRYRISRSHRLRRIHRRKARHVRRKLGEFLKRLRSDDFRRVLTPRPTWRVLRRVIENQYRRVWVGRGSGDPWKTRDYVYPAELYYYWESLPALTEPPGEGLVVISGFSWIFKDDEDRERIYNAQWMTLGYGPTLEIALDSAMHAGLISDQITEAPSRRLVFSRLELKRFKRPKKKRGETV